MALRALSLWLLVLILPLRAGGRAAREPLRIIETALGLLNASATLRALATLTDAAGSDVLRICAVRLVGGLRRASGALAEGGTGCRAGRLTDAHETLHALATASVQLLAVVIGGKAAHSLTMTMLVIDIAVRARRVLLCVEALGVRRLRWSGALGLLRRR